VNADCPSGEACAVPDDGVFCVDSAPATAEKINPLVVDFGLSMMMLPKALLNYLKASQPIDPLTGKPGAIAVINDCSRTSNGGSVGYTTWGSDSLLYSADVMPTTGIHELGHLFVARSAVTPWTVSGHGLATFDMTGGVAQCCYASCANGPMCTDAPCNGCAGAAGCQCLSPLVCRQGQLTRACTYKSCQSDADCGLSVYPYFSGPCVNNRCNGGRPYGFVNGYATDGSCTSSSSGCHSFVEAMVTYRFGGDAFRNVVIADAIHTPRSCDQFDYVRSVVYSGVQFKGLGDDQGAPYRPQVDGLLYDNQAWYCQ